MPDQRDHDGPEESGVQTSYSVDPAPDRSQYGASRHANDGETFVVGGKKILAISSRGIIAYVGRNIPLGPVRKTARWHVISSPARRHLEYVGLS
jgi:hypothetical protein